MISANIIPTEISLDAPFILLGRFKHTNLPIKSIKLIPLSLIECGKDIISRDHAYVYRESSEQDDYDYNLIDAGSLNGLYVNNRRIKSHKLKHGDVVQFGGSSNVQLGEKVVRSAAHIKYVFWKLSSNVVLKLDSIVPSQEKILPACHNEVMKLTVKAYNNSKVEDIEENKRKQESEKPLAQSTRKKQKRK